MKIQGKWTQLGLAVLAAFALACGGAEEMEPEFESSESALKSGGGFGNGSSCSASGAWCYDHRDNFWDVDNGCSITCTNGNAICINATCGVDGTILFTSICRCSRTNTIF